MNRDFQTIPAIDLMDGQCVRLLRGAADQKKVYSDNPPEMAKQFQASGARRLHVIDLDGAFRGEQANFDAIRAIRQRVSMSMEVGGGLRDADSIQRLFDLGVEFAILGTRAADDAGFLKSMLERHGNRIIVGVDARDGKVAVEGWVRVRGDLTALDFARQLQDMGAKTIIYTDIATDGAMKGPNLEAQRQMAEAVSLDVIASGGVASIDDLRALAAIPCGNLIGSIVGKAIYDGSVDLQQAVQALAATSSPEDSNP